MIADWAISKLEWLIDIEGVCNDIGEYVVGSSLSIVETIVKGFIKYL